MVNLFVLSSWQTAAPKVDLTTSAETDSESGLLISSMFWLTQSCSSKQDDAFCDHFGGGSEVIFKGRIEECTM